VIALVHDVRLIDLVHDSRAARKKRHAAAVERRPVRVVEHLARAAADHVTANRHLAEFAAEK
jgi:hypothetical protein